MKNNFKQALEDLLDGKPVIVVDSMDRENEGDLVFCAEKITKKSLIFAINNAKGLMCLPCEGEILDRLEIPIMVPKTTDPLETPFTVSVDGMTTGTGMSVDDRMKTISTMLDPNSKRTDFKFPGHLFPLRSRKGLLKERQGHTEAAVTLMNLIGAKPVAVIIEIMTADCQMMRLPELTTFAEINNLQLISIEEIYQEAYKD